MQTQLNSSSIAQVPVISVIQDPLTSTPSSTDHSAMLQRLAARLTYLADAANVQGKYDLETTITRTVAEILTSSKEISSSTYASAFISRLAKSVRKIEKNLADTDLTAASAFTPRPMELSTFESFSLL